MRKVALITQNARKAEEWTLLLRPQGISVAQILPDSDSPEQLLNQGFDLVCREQSSLVEPGGDQLADMEHLLTVDHLCIIESWHRDKGQRSFRARRSGYIDATRPLEAGGWWDAQFCDAGTGLSYQEQAVSRGTKLSARSAAIEHLVDEFLPVARRGAYLEADQRVVALERSLIEVVRSNDCFQCLSPELEGLVAGALSQGLVLSLGQTRAQQVYFWPGLSGIPSVARSSPVDEAKFLFHDLVHFLIGRLVPDGPMDEHQRQVFLAWAMVEEAVALLLADGFFVDHLRRRGWDYDFDQHKGYPFFSAQGWRDQSFAQDKLWANVRFFVLGDRSGCPHPEDERALRYFEGFERFSLGDWLWNERMSLHARKDSEFYRRWWELAEPLNSRHRLGVLNLSAAAASIPPGGPLELVRGVFDYIWKHRIQPAQGTLSSLSRSDERAKAGWRWLLGQLGLFAAFPEDPALQRAARLLKEAERFETVPRFFQQCLNTAVQHGLCSSHQARRWGEFFPLFPPFYISYKERPGLTVAALSERILGPEGGAKELENELDVVNAIICDRSRQRFLLERKVNHPIALFDRRFCLIGGYRQHPAETMVNAWRREACEEWTDAESLQVAQQLADRLVPWRRFLVQGAERPGEFGMEIMLVELAEEEFDRVAEVLQRNNSYANRPEGWPEVKRRDEIPDLLLLSGHAVVLSAFLER
ncbi:MAG: hypothetical protein KF760_03670 [Candidatus Eremiobacteraeota bacterium]|nr:hypothetical protein [Candidatus Eremiobacteraeota bacterium]